MRHLFAILLFLVVLVGCGENDSKSTVVPIDQVPPALVKIAQETLPEVKFDRARKKPNGVYEIQGKGEKGKLREVELSSDGKVLEIE
jgi:hypothetical protein